MNTIISCRTIQDFVFVTAVGAFTQGAAKPDDFLEQMQRSCLKLIRYHPDNKPLPVIITCSSIQTEWRQEGAQTSNIVTNNLEIYASLSSLYLGTPKAMLEKRSAPIECPTYNEWRGIVPGIDVSTSCGQIIHMKRSDIYCAEALTETLSADPSLIIWEKTGRSYNPCEDRQAPAS
jgi:hypothetical protein